ncbi:MAG: CcoQ/FixQ family Cbb3-type cytochrome c oxidase assembly chaperone [Myxococcales bacterium]|nr:CcoQ/FixQ family Cbb3-type cytochrome c oxidase assembly chaperone [Myxococcales bacterium]
MSLSELMSKMGVADFTGAALIIFFVVFIAVGVRALLYRKQTVEYKSQLPFEDGTKEPSR